MAKGYKNNPQLAKLEIESTNHRGKEFTTSTGVTVRIIGLNQKLYDGVRSSIEFPEVPMYEAPIGSGKEIELHPINQTVLDDPSLTDEEREELEIAWEEYTRDLREAELELNQRVVSMILLKGIQVDMPDDDEWIKEQEFLGIEIPKNFVERKLHWIDTEVIATYEDLLTIMELVMDQTGIPSEALAEAKKLFRGRGEEE